MYINETLKKYLDDLAARLPAPGGGSAAALAASVGVGLMSMVANYTVGNPKYKAAAERMADILLKCEKARAELETLIDRDVTEYGKASCGMKSFAKGSKELEEVYKSAAEPPLEVCRIAGECIRLCGELAEIGNRNLITDTAIAAIFLEGAFFAGKFNVYINLKYIKDLAYVEKIHGILSPLESEIPALKEAVLERCEDMIGG